MRTLVALAVVSLIGAPLAAQEHPEGPVHFVRYELAGAVSYGMLDGERIMRIEGDVFGEHDATEDWVDLADVTLLPPTNPRKVIAIGLNYRSHLGDREPAAEPGMFAKYPTSLVGHGEDILLPEGAENVHYEAEVVLVIGKECRDVPLATAKECVFAVTAGNDVSERNWQASDLQWLRAKASDTFGPVGPSMVWGLDPDDLSVESRLNGEVRQQGHTSDLIFDVATIVSYVSKHITLEPGDQIWTGTPGTTAAMQPGDVVEIEVGGVGVLRNTVRRR